MNGSVLALKSANFKLNIAKIWYQISDGNHHRSTSSHFPSTIMQTKLTKPISIDLQIGPTSIILEE